MAQCGYKNNELEVSGKREWFYLVAYERGRYNIICTIYMRDNRRMDRILCHWGAEQAKELEPNCNFIISTGIFRIFRK